jgi:site-specific DNA recombinase
MDTPTTQTELSLAELKRRYHGYLGQRASSALAAKARRGECPGYAPTGYRNVRTEHGTHVEIDPHLGPLIHEAFYLAGRRGSSLRKVLAELTPKGLVSRNGNPMNASALQNILTNPFYVGMLRYKGQLIRGKHEPLVTASCFDRVGRRLRHRRRRVAPAAARPPLAPSRAGDRD